MHQVFKTCVIASNSSYSDSMLRKKSFVPHQNRVNPEGVKRLFRKEKQGRLHESTRSMIYVNSMRAIK